TVIDADHARSLIDPLWTQTREAIDRRIAGLRQVPGRKSVDHRSQLRKRAENGGTVGSAGSESLQRLIQPLARSFKSHEKERFVPRERPARVDTELIQAKRGIARRERI